MPRATNIYDDVPSEASGEQFTDLLAAEGIRIERIVSTGQTSPPGFWYDQASPEWVLLLSGSAAVRFEGESALRQLNKGDYLLIPARRRHRVEWTDPTKPTIWLAIHFGPEVRQGEAVSSTG